MNGRTGRSPSFSAGSTAVLFLKVFASNFRELAAFGAVAGIGFSAMTMIFATWPTLGFAKGSFMAGFGSELLMRVVFFVGFGAIAAVGAYSHLRGDLHDDCGRPGFLSCLRAGLCRLPQCFVAMATPVVVLLVGGWVLGKTLSGFLYFGAWILFGAVLLFAMIRLSVWLEVVALERRSLIGAAVRSNTLARNRNGAVLLTCVMLLGMVWVPYCVILAVLRAVPRPDGLGGHLISAAFDFLLVATLSTPLVRASSFALYTRLAETEATQLRQPRGSAETERT